jgi:hypothetical protein
MRKKTLKQTDVLLKTSTVGTGKVSPGIKLGSGLGDIKGESQDERF